MDAAGIMNTDLLVVDPEDNALELGQSMEKYHVGHAIVAQDMHFMGFVTKETFVSHMFRFPDSKLATLTARDLMEDDVDRLKPEDSLERIVDLMMYQKSLVDIMPVLDEDKIKGVISTADLVRLYAASMVKRFKVADLMHYNPVTVEDYTPLHKVVEYMRNMCVKRVLVMQKDTLVGIVSIKDIGLNLFKHQLLGQGTSPTTELCAEDIMSPNPLVVSSKLDAAEVANMMLEKKVGGVPVVSDRLEGMLDRKDLLKGFTVV